MDADALSQSTKNTMINIINVKRLQLKKGKAGDISTQAWVQGYSLSKLDQELN